VDVVRKQKLYVDVDVVRKQKLYVDIRGNEHPQVEAWQALGALLRPFNAAVLTRLGRSTSFSGYPACPSGNGSSPTASTTSSAISASRCSRARR
jgi:hypothetical protein